MEYPDTVSIQATELAALEAHLGTEIDAHLKLAH